MEDADADQPGKYSLGPGQATLRILTGRSGAAAKAGHDLSIEVTILEGRGRRRPSEAAQTSLDPWTADALLVARARGHRWHEGS